MRVYIYDMMCNETVISNNNTCSIKLHVYLLFVISFYRANLDFLKGKKHEISLLSILSYTTR